MNFIRIMKERGANKIDYCYILFGFSHIGHERFYSLLKNNNLLTWAKE